MDLIPTKICVAILFFVLRFFFGILPVKIHKLLLRWEGQDDTQHFISKKRHQQVKCTLALFQSFGGGVLFATCLLHMMPEVYLSVEELKKYGNLNTDYPLSQMTISLGFFLVYFVEEFSHWFITKVPEEGCGSNNKVKAEESKTPETPRSNTKVAPLKSEFVIQENYDDSFVVDENNKVIPFKEPLSRPRTAFVIEDQFLQENYNSFTLDEEVLRENEKNNEKSDETSSEESIAEEQKQKEREYISSQQIVRQVLILLALSLHAIFEGLAIGLQTSTANIWYLFVAVMIHSATILFYISLQLILAQALQRVIIINVLVLSLTSPTGVLLGLLITLKANMNTKAKSIAVVLLEGLSAGTILYITFFEVLNKEKEKRVFRFRRALCILAGFVLMALLQLWEIHFDN